MAIGIFIEYDGTRTQLPVNPAELSIPRQGDNESTNVLSIGEVTVIKTAKLAEITIESYFPAFPDAPAVLTKANFQKPQYYLDLITRIRDDKKPARLIVTDTNINILVSIESFERKFVAMDDDIHYNLVLKEYREYGVRTVPLPAPAATPSPEPVQVPAPAATPARSNTTGNITIGASVVVNGRLHADSFGNGAGQTRTNYAGKVNFIKTGRTHPYHVTTPGGGWLGWVTAEAVRLS